MKRLTPDSPELKSADLVAENLERLRELFPEAFASEGKIDFDVLRQLLGDRVDDGEERYGLNWHGKRAARQLALTPSTGTLRPCPEESVDWDTTQNIFIEGDNLEVLKLLQKSYAGKVKLIYIDPPYNTGKDFVYPDNFQDSIKNYLEITGQSEGGQRVASNTEASGRFHTDWLNMMYPRLKLARNLLTHDGAIFVSCDEAEQARLRLAMDDVFGGENFVADMVWAAGRKNDSRLISLSHEYIICYARDADHLTEQKIEWRQRKKGLEDIYGKYEKLKREYGTNYEAMTAAMKEWYKGLADSHPAKAHKHYAHVDARGIYFPDNISWPGGGGPKYEVLHPRTKKPVAVPSRGWMTSDPLKMKQWIDDDRVHFGPDESSVPCIKSYLRDRELQTPYSVFYQDGRAATKRLRDLMGADCFDFPKDETVLQEIVEMLTSGSDLVMDFFAGSGTTGHAVMTQNAADGGNRRYILVQLPEPLDPENTNQKVAADVCEQLGKPRNIAELTKERLRRAAKRVKEENPKFAGDLSYRVFRLDSGNVQPWESTRDTLADSLAAAVEHVKPDRTKDDLLYDIILKHGLDLCSAIEEKQIGSHNVCSVGGGAVFGCFGSRITAADVEQLADGIAKWRDELAPANPELSRVVFRDSAFESDVAKTNLALILKERGFDEKLVVSL